LIYFNQFRRNWWIQHNNKCLQLNINFSLKINTSRLIFMVSKSIPSFYLANFLPWIQQISFDCQFNQVHFCFFCFLMSILR
jgi:hypothetical protein